MSKSIIPWHVFEGAIQTMTPESLDLWLQRWRFMDAGVILSDTNIPALNLPKTILNLLKEENENYSCDNVNETTHFKNFIT